MKYITFLLLSLFALASFAQTDTILENSYKRMLNKRLDQLAQIEGIWELESTITEMTGKKVTNSIKKNTRVAIYQAGNIYAVTYLSKEFFSLDQIRQISDDNDYYFERPDQMLRAQVVIEGAKLTVLLIKEIDIRKQQNEYLVFTKVYPAPSSSTLEQR